jgi:type IV pilus assembly protein PilA
MLRNREGFTLIELLIVVVIIGILAAIALPKFGQTREAAYYTTMKADLTNLRSAQEMYYQTQGAFIYADNLATLEFAPSRGVTIAPIVADNMGWTAVANHSALTALGCAIAYGEPTAMPATPGGHTITATEVGAPVCDDQFTP